MDQQPQATTVPVSEMEVSEAEIASHWREEEYYQPPTAFIGQANASEPAIFDRFREERFPECFKEYADLLSWDQYWHTTLDTSNPPFWKWFVGGRINACYNCVDRHLPNNKNKAAFIFVPELEEEPSYTLTYQELYIRVNEVAAVLRHFCGLQKGDRVTIHMPMIPELPSRCSRARGLASCIRWSSADSAARPPGCGRRTRAAGS